MFYPVEDLIDKNSESSLIKHLLDLTQRLEEEGLRINTLNITSDILSNGKPPPTLSSSSTLSSSTTTASNDYSPTSKSSSTSSISSLSATFSGDSTDSTTTSDVEPTAETQTTNMTRKDKLKRLSLTKIRHIKNKLNRLSLTRDRDVLSTDSVVKREATVPSQETSKVVKREKTSSKNLAKSERRETNHTHQTKMTDSEKLTAKKTTPTLSRANLNVTSFVDYKYDYDECENKPRRRREHYLLHYDNIITFFLILLLFLIGFNLILLIKLANIERLTNSLIANSTFMID